MATFTSAPITQDQALALHAALLRDDPVAPSDLALAYYEYLIRYLRERNPAIDEQLCVTAAGDAILALIKHPGSYDPARGPLDGYLRMSARGDLRNLLERERRHQSRQANLEAVEKSPELGNQLGDERTNPERIVAARERLEEVLRQREPIPEVVLDGLTPKEHAVLALMREGEWRTSTFAGALGIADRPFPEQQREVKRVKDRLKKRIERSGDRG